MPGGAFTGGQSNFADQGTNLAASVGTTLTASASTNTKGTYAQLVASTPSDAAGFLLQIMNPTTGGNTFLVDLAIGAAGSEIVLVANVPFQVDNTVDCGKVIFVPCAIPAGSRIAARCQCSTASNVLTASVVLVDGNFCDLPSLGAPQTYGALTATSRGTAIDPGAIANTKGAWVQIVASTAVDISALQIIFDGQLNSFGSALMLLDIGVGAGGSEIVVVPNIAVLAHTAAAILTGACEVLLRKKIPAGSRIALRCQNTNTTSTSRKVGATILGYPQ